MDDTTQNPNPTAAPAAPMSDPAMPVTPAMPTDPMSTAQVPDLPTAPVAADPAPAVQPASQPMDVLQSDSAQAMAQMAVGSNTVPQMPVPDPMPAPTVPDPMASVPTDQTQNTTMSSLGPVTMEDLMEELQHIEDKLDEMDEKL